MLHVETTMKDYPSYIVVRLTLIVSFLCLTAPLLPDDLQPILSYARAHTPLHPEASSADCCCEESSSSSDGVLTEGEWQRKECCTLLLSFMLFLSLQGGEEQHPALPPILVEVYSFPRKILPRPALDDPFLS